MVQLGTTCLRRLAQGREDVEIRFGRLLRNERVTTEGIIAGGSAETALAVAGRHVLAIQDTSELNFRTSDRHRRGLGVIGKGVGRGILLHPMIAVDAGSGECLGLIGGSLWTRHGPRVAEIARKQTRRRRLEEKEARRWVETPQAAKGVLEAAAMVTMIADREADLYTLWARVPAQGMHVLGRICRDRRLADGGTLMTAARQWPVLGTRRLTIREREERPERVALLELRAGSVTLLRPQEDRAPGLPEQLTMTFIELDEPSPPAGAEPVTWRLLTTHAAPDAAAAWQLVDWYRRRWVIEQFFRILKKQGLQIEDSQLETADRLLKLVAIATRAAVIVLQLNQARDGSSTLAAADVFSPAELATLEAVEASYRTSPQRNPHPRSALPWAAWIIARLGGWNGRPTAKPPGPITFKHGLDILQTMAKGWELRDLYTL
jgi:hypothetical protein